MFNWVGIVWCSLMMWLFLGIVEPSTVLRGWIAGLMFYALWNTNIPDDFKFFSDSKDNKYGPRPTPYQRSGRRKRKPVIIDQFKDLEDTDEWDNEGGAVTPPPVPHKKEDKDKSKGGGGRVFENVPCKNENFEDLPW